MAFFLSEWFSVMSQPLLVLVWSLKNTVSCSN